MYSRKSAGLRNSPKFVKVSFAGNDRLLCFISKSKMRHPSLPHIEQEYRESLILGKIHIQLNSNEDLRYW